ncbi:MAG: hypothetical protein ACTSQ8_22480 [Candidatus Helarchaeota archaeon]
MKKYICNKCGTDFSTIWHGRIENGKIINYCDHCWKDAQSCDEAFALGGELSDYTRKLRSSLGKNEFLGPYNKQTGSRGVFKHIKK